ncbi:hypothetical protein V5O48_001854 [Marasmius crinis-equi]|uniref:Uncharacterized protein n=1 Tax=Marasmius crinis-equi TaxID=585013 RepID=A0ABR3FX96_9AGAR
MSQPPMSYHSQGPKVLLTVLCTVLADVFLEQFEPNEVVRLQLVHPILNRAVQRFFWRRYVAMLEQFFPNPNDFKRFREVMKDTGSFIVGSCLMNVLKSSALAHTELDLFCDLGSFDVVRGFMDHSGQYRGLSVGDGSRRTDSSYHRGIVGSCRYEAATLLATGLSRTVNIFACETTPLVSLLQSHSSECYIAFRLYIFSIRKYGLLLAVAMIFATHTKIISLFPYTTFRMRDIVVCSAVPRHRDTSNSAHLDEWASRGWHVRYSPSVGSLCRVATEFSRFRRVGDAATWSVQLGEESESDPTLFCNSWNQVVYNSDCFAISFETGKPCLVEKVLTAALPLESIVVHALKEEKPCHECVEDDLNWAILGVISDMVDSQHRSPDLKKVLIYIRAVLEGLPSDLPQPKEAAVYYLRRRITPLYVSLKYPPAMSMVTDSVGETLLCRVSLYFPSRLYKRDDFWLAAEEKPFVPMEGYVITPYFGYPPAVPPPVRFRNDRDHVRRRQCVIYDRVQEQLRRGWRRRMNEQDIPIHKMDQLLGYLPDILNWFSYDSVKLEVHFDCVRGVHVSVHFPFYSMHFTECPVRFSHNEQAGHVLNKERLRVLLYAGRIPWLG